MIAYMQILGSSQGLFVLLLQFGFLLFAGGLAAKGFLLIAAARKWCTSEIKSGGDLTGRARERAELAAYYDWPLRLDEFEETLQSTVGDSLVKAEGIARTLPMLGLLGTFIGMMFALLASSSAQSTVADQLAQGGSMGEAELFNDPDASVGEESELEFALRADRVRDALRGQVDDATEALSEYVTRQQTAIRAMGFGVSTSIIGLFFSLVLVPFIRLGRNDVKYLRAHLEDASLKHYIVMRDRRPTDVQLTERLAELPVQMRDSLGAMVTEIQTMTVSVASLSETATAQVSQLDQNTEALNDANAKFSTLLERYKDVGQRYDEVNSAFRNIQRSYEGIQGDVRVLTGSLDGIVSAVEGWTNTASTSVQSWANQTSEQLKSEHESDRALWLEAQRNLTVALLEAVEGLPEKIGKSVDRSLNASDAIAITRPRQWFRLLFERYRR